MSGPTDSGSRPPPDGWPGERPGVQPGTVPNARTGERTDERRGARATTAPASRPGGARSGGSHRSGSPPDGSRAGGSGAARAGGAVAGFVAGLIGLRRGPWEMLATVLIALGVFMLMQPFVMWAFTYSFVTTLVGTVMFIVVSHFRD